VLTAQKKSKLTEVDRLKRRQENRIKQAPTFTEKRKFKKEQEQQTKKDNKMLEKRNTLEDSAATKETEKKPEGKPPSTVQFVGSGRPTLI
jgi:hypothetical protein